jgi:hypothetical protein
MAAGLTAVGLVAALAASGPARAASADEGRLLGLTNGLRASVGAQALALDDALSAVARAWAAKMAAAGTISHNPSLTSQVGPWSKVAENVGMGPDLDTVHRALVASRPHYVNLVDTEVALIGIGVVTSGGSVFVVEDFLRRPGAAVAAPTAPTTVATAPPPTRAASPPATTAVRPAPTVPPATVPPTTVPAPGVTVPMPSPWLALALEMTRGWARATG